MLNFIETPGATDIAIKNGVYYINQAVDLIAITYNSRSADLNVSKSDIEAFPINDQYLDQVEQHMAAKMRWFAKGFYTVTKNKDTVRVYNLQVDMRGATMEGNIKVPTVGYFKIVNKNGTSEFSSGSIQQ